MLIEHRDRSYPRKHRLDHIAIVDRLLRNGKSFNFFPEGGNGCCIVYILVKVIPNIRSMEGKTNSKVFSLTCREKIEKEELQAVASTVSLCTQFPLVGYGVRSHSILSWLVGS